MSIAVIFLHKEDEFIPQWLTTVGYLNNSVN